MLMPLGQILRDRERPVQVNRSMTIKDALKLMMEHDFSQLPVVDDDDHYLGIISEQSVMRLMYHGVGYEDVLNLTIDHAEVDTAVRSPQDDLTVALDDLKSVYAVVVVSDRRAVGILTYADTTDFFRNFTEGFVLVRDIEIMLRQLVDSTFRDDEKRDAAFRLALSQRYRRSPELTLSTDDLSLGELLRVVEHEQNWSEFDTILHPQSLFHILLDRVRKTRNDIMHFKGDLQQDTIDALKDTRRWLEKRPKRILADTSDVRVSRTVETTAYVEDARLAYIPFAVWLLQPEIARVIDLRISFDDVAKILGLPPSSLDEAGTSFWANDTIGNPVSRAWLVAGRRVTQSDSESRMVVFSRSAQLSFIDALDIPQKDTLRLEEIVPPIIFSSGRPELHFRWRLTSKTLYIALVVHFDVFNESATAIMFLQLEQKEIEAEIGLSVTFVDPPIPEDYEGSEEGQALTDELEDEIIFDEDESADEDMESEIAEVESDEPGHVYIEIPSGSRASGKNMTKRGAVEIVFKFVDALSKRIEDLPM